MSNYKKRPVNCPVSVYRPRWGAFLDGHHRGQEKILHKYCWTHCREIWSLNWHPNFWFKHSKRCGKRIARFIGLIEKRLKLKHRSKFKPTQNSDITWIEPSDFWQPDLRTSLFTALLRAGDKYRRSKGFKKALYSVSYTKNTKPAIKRFMSGCVSLSRKAKRKYMGMGWVEVFQDRHRARLLH